MVAADIVVGLAAAVASARWMHSLLYGVTPTDPRSLAAAAVYVALGAAVATALPLARARLASINISPCRSPRAHGSALTRSPPCWVRAVWAGFTARETRGFSAKSPSKSCLTSQESSAKDSGQPVPLTGIRACCE